MKRLHYLVVFSCFFVLSIMMTVEAQRNCTDPATGGAIVCPPTAEPVQPSAPDIPDADGDGTADATDQCPNQGGPAQNNGCPLAPDADGDGTPDLSDECPNQGGPDWNNGCPIDETSTSDIGSLPPLPQFPSDPNAMDENGVVPCLVATLTTLSVNLREIPDINSPVQSILDPFEPIYGWYRFVYIRGTTVETWYMTSRGFAASWVTRLSPQCENQMTTFTFDYNKELAALIAQNIEVSSLNVDTIREQFTVMLICPEFSTVLLPTSALTDCDGNGVSPAPNGERFLCDDTWVEAYEDCTFPDALSFPAVLISESAQMMTLSIPPSIMPDASSVDSSNEQGITLAFGNTSSMDGVLFNPEIEHPPDPGLFVVLLLGDVPDVNLVGFNPQPEPPALETNFGLLLGLNIPDVDIVGFNPQPEPPALITNAGEFSLNPTERGYQLINAEGVGVEIGLVDLNMISVDDLSLWPFPNMPDMTMWLVEGEDGEGTTIMCSGSEVSFNPQPEPPALEACFTVTPVG